MTRRPGDPLHTGILYAWLLSSSSQRHLLSLVAWPVALYPHQRVTGLRGHPCWVWRLNSCDCWEFERIEGLEQRYGNFIQKLNLGPTLNFPKLVNRYSHSTQSNAFFVSREQIQSGVSVRGEYNISNRWQILVFNKAGLIFRCDWW